MEQDQLLREAHAALRGTFGERLGGVVLYGSQARGDEEPLEVSPLLTMWDLEQLHHPRLSAKSEGVPDPLPESRAVLAALRVPDVGTESTFQVSRLANVSNPPGERAVECVDERHACFSLGNAPVPL